MVTISLLSINLEGSDRAPPSQFTTLTKVDLDQAVSTLPISSSDQRKSSHEQKNFPKIEFLEFDKSSQGYSLTIASCSSCTNQHL